MVFGGTVITYGRGRGGGHRHRHGDPSSSGASPVCWRKSPRRPRPWRSAWPWWGAPRASSAWRPRWAPPSWGASWGHAWLEMLIWGITLGGGRGAGVIAGGGHRGTGHRHHPHGPAPRHRQTPAGSGNHGLHHGDLHRQDRHPHQKRDRTAKRLFSGRPGNRGDRVGI